MVCPFSSLPFDDLQINEVDGEASNLSNFIFGSWSSLL